MTPRSVPDDREIHSCIGCLAVLLICIGFGCLAAALILAVVQR